MFALFFALLSGPMIGPLDMEEASPQVISAPKGEGFFCDFLSDTCSDGRKIVTERSTPVPCEKEEGVWSRAEVDEGCYNWKGELEIAAQNTSYLSWGSDFGQESWNSWRGGTVEAIADGFRVRNDPNQNHSGIAQSISGAGGEGIWTSAYILRSFEDVPYRLWAGSSQWCGSDFTLNTGGRWERFSCTTTVPQTPMASIWPGSNAGDVPRPQYYVDAKASWVVRASLPGRACWDDSEAPVHCAADRHSVSTDDFPTERGAITIAVTIKDNYFPIGGDVWLLDGRDVSNPEAPNPYIQSTGRIRFRAGGVVHGSGSPTLEWDIERTYLLRFEVGGEETRIYRDGVFIYSAATGPWAWAEQADLGQNYSVLNSRFHSISHFEVRK